MPSFLDAWTHAGSAAPEARRHTIDPSARPTTSNNTPAVSRSSSVASNRSEPSWFSSHNGLDTSNTQRPAQPILSSNNSSEKLTQKPGTTATSGWKALFSGAGSDDRKEKKKPKQKESDKIILTSKHAAAVKTKMAMEQRRRSLDSASGGTGIMNGNQDGPHLTAEEQERRFPHSGPPALHGGEQGHIHRKGRKGSDVNVDMPLLTRIVSGDERDEEEDRARLGREAWVTKRKDAEMRRFTVAEGMGVEEGESGSGDEEREGEFVEGKVMVVEGTRLIGAEVEGDAHTPRAKAKGGIGHGWRRGDTGKWTR